MGDDNRDQQGPTGTKKQQLRPIRTDHPGTNVYQEQATRFERTSTGMRRAPYTRDIISRVQPTMTTGHPKVYGQL